MYLLVVCDTLDTGNKNYKSSVFNTKLFFVDEVTWSVPLLLC